MFIEILPESNPGGVAEFGGDEGGCSGTGGAD